MRQELSDEMPFSCERPFVVPRMGSCREWELKLWGWMLQGVMRIFYRIQNSGPHGRRSDDHDENLTVPIPGVANAEEDAGVVAGIVIAEAGVGVVNDVKPEIDGALRPNKPMDAATDLRRSEEQT